MRRITRKAHKRLGFVDYTSVFPHLYRGYPTAPLFDPKASIMITGTGA